MLYKAIAFNIIAYHENITQLNWKTNKLINDRFCNKVKRLYGCEWSYGLGDGCDTYFNFYFLDNRLITQAMCNGIRLQLKTMGVIISELLDSPTKYNHSILKHHDLVDWPTWYHYKLFVDRNKNQYKKVFGCKWYVETFTNREGTTKAYTYSYLDKVEVRNYKQ